MSTRVRSLSISEDDGLIVDKRPKESKAEDDETDDCESSTTEEKDEKLAKMATAIKTVLEVFSSLAHLYLICLS